MYNFFPPWYHESSTATMINIKQLDKINLLYDDIHEFEISNNVFKNHRTSEILGKSSWNTTTIDVNNYASILCVDFMLSQVHINISHNTIHDIISTGFYSGLFTRYYTFGNFTFTNNLVYNIGYMTKEETTVKLPYIAMDIESTE